MPRRIYTYGAKQGWGLWFVLMARLERCRSSARPHCLWLFIYQRLQAHAVTASAPATIPGTPRRWSGPSPRRRRSTTSCRHRPLGDASGPKLCARDVRGDEHGAHVSNDASWQPPPSTSQRRERAASARASCRTRPTSRSTAALGFFITGLGILFRDPAITLGLLAPARSSRWSGWPS